MQIRKRDGTIVDYDGEKIVTAIEKAVEEVKGVSTVGDYNVARGIEINISEGIEKGKCLDTVEDIQDAVEKYLMREGGYEEVAKAYILYREQRNQRRGQPEKFKYLSNNFLKKYESIKNPFPQQLGEMVYKRTYARPVPEEGRREDWWETVARVVEFSADLEVQARKRQGLKMTPEVNERLINTAEEMYEHMFNLGLFPSGRSLWVGGTEPSYKYPLSNFNCSFITIDELEKFSEMFFVLMLGTGVGLSVERKYVNKLPRVRTSLRMIHKDYSPVAREDRLEFTELVQTADNILQLNVGDSKYGWSSAMERYFDIMSSKQYEEIDFLVINYDNVRPKGEPLKTFGGYASGHGNLKAMFEKIDALLQKKEGKWVKLQPIDTLDIATAIAENVVSGGVRRSALIIFTEEDEKDVIEAKMDLYTQTDGGEWKENKDLLHRALSNNTIKYYQKPIYTALENHVKTMRNTGEPGFLNMAMVYGRREDAEGGNPCMEIFLRDRGVCNLTEINMAAYVNEKGEIDYAGLFAAQRLSALIGYRMATIELEIHKWNLVNEEDRLTGCSLTGITDFMQKANLTTEEMRPILNRLREIAHNQADGLADELGLNRPKLVTTIKPSGTVSQLPTVASGLHYNHAEFYIRRVRVSSDDPIAEAMDAMGFTWYPENGETRENHKTKVFEFPVKAPGTKFKGDVTAVEQLEWYKLLMEEYVDHNASITVHVRDHEWEIITDWLYDNWDSVAGVSFLPYDGGVYSLAPYEEIDEERYNKMVEETPQFDSKAINRFERFGEEFDVLDSDCDTGFCPIR